MVVVLLDGFRVGGEDLKDDKVVMMMDGWMLAGNFWDRGWLEMEEVWFVVDERIVCCCDAERQAKK
jgi:hypothetical protein